MTTQGIASGVTVLASAALAVGADTLDQMPRSWLLTLIGVLATAFTTALSLIVWSFKRGVDRIEGSIKRSEVTDETHSTLIVATQRMIAEVDQKLEVHAAEEMRLFDGCVKQEYLGRSLSTLHEKINNLSLDSAARLAVLESKVGELDDEKKS